MKITPDKYNSVNNSRIGQSFEEKMEEYRQVKEAAQKLNNNKQAIGNQMANYSWGKMLLIIFLFLLIGAMCLFFGSRGLKSVLNTEGKIYTSGKIVYVWSGNTYNDGASLEVRYYVDGDEYKSRIETSRKRSEFRTGDSISIYYYEDAPYDIYSNYDEASGAVPLIAGVIFVIIAIMLFLARVKAGITGK